MSANWHELFRELGDWKREHPWRWRWIRRFRGGSLPDLDMAAYETGHRMIEIGQPVCELHERRKVWLGGEWECMCCLSGCDCWMEAE